MDVMSICLIVICDKSGEVIVMACETMAPGNGKLSSGAPFINMVQLNRSIDK